MPTPMRFATLLVTLAIVLPLAAGAQNPPSYAQPAGGDAQIRGRVLAFDGHYSLQVRDDQGYTDNVQLHDGTIINPTGLRLAAGMVVSILGYNAGPYFAANEIDTPYTYYGGVPYFAGHPWNYYGPSVSIGFFFGHLGWWHGAAFTAPYHYARGVRIYQGVHVNAVYRGGSFQGRNYSASREHGGYDGRGGESRHR